MIDAAGAIYVIGGYSGTSPYYHYYYSDVWASTDGGARPDSGVVVAGTRGGY